MKNVFVYTQLDLEDLDVYIAGVYSEEKDAVKAMDEDIMGYAKTHKEFDYNTSTDSNGIPLNMAAKEFSFYIEGKVLWEIHAEILDFEE